MFIHGRILGERWRHDPEVDAKGVYTVACRGVSYHESAQATDGACARRIIVSTIDGRMIALDAANGRPCAGFGRGGQISLREGLGQVERGFHYS